MINDLYFQMSKQHSLPFISYQNEEFIIHQQAIQYFQSLPAHKHCHLLSILGKSKTGKSYLINKLFHLYHQQQHHTTNIQYFPVSNHIYSSTKGINILSSFVEFQDKIIIFLDAEGLGNLGGNQTYESKLAATLMLLSSTIIYNNIGAIDQQTLTNLGFLIEIGKMFEKSIVQKDKGGFSLPSFFMILRDFSLTLQNKNHHTINASQYLQNSLEEPNGVSQALLHKNRIRRMIKELFRDRDCQTLVLPSQDVPINFDSKTRPQFQDQLKKVWCKINIQINNNPKKINHKILQAKEYLCFMQHIVQAINTNTKYFPKIDNILVHLYKKQVAGIHHEFNQNYKSLIEQFNNVSKNIDRLIDQSESIQKKDQFCMTILKELEQQSGLIISLISKIQCIYEKSCIQLQQLINRQGKLETYDPTTSKLSYNNPNIAKIKQFTQLYEQKISLCYKMNIKQKDITQYLQTFKTKVQQLQNVKRQQQKYNKIIENIYIIKNEKQLDEIYRQFINYFKNGAITIKSQIFNNNLLRCEVAYLRRKLQLKNREQNNICIDCQIDLHDKMPLDDIINRHNCSNRYRSNEKSNNLSHQPQQLYKTNQYSSNQKSLLSSSKSKWITPFQSKQNKQISHKSFYIPYIIIQYPQSIHFEIIRTLVKQDIKHNNYTEYVIQIVLYNKKWTFNRKWKDFNQLYNILSNIFEQEEIPVFDGGHANVGQIFLKEQIEVRRSKLQSYVRELLSIENVRNSRIMQKFLKINKQYITNL